MINQLSAVFKPKQEQQEHNEKSIQMQPEKPAQELESDQEIETGNSESELGDELPHGDHVISIKELHEALPEIKTLIRKHRKNTEALLASARGFSVKNGVIIIAFQSPVLKERLEKGDHQDIIQRAFSHVLGMEVLVRAVVNSSKDALYDQDYDLEANPLVSEAIKLGGKIVDKE